jgi:glycosidase
VSPDLPPQDAPLNDPQTDGSAGRDAVGASGVQAPSAEPRLPAYRIIELARRFRRRYRYDRPFTSDPRAARELAHRIGRLAPGAAVRASELNALALIEEIFRYVLHLYSRQRSQSLFRDLLASPALKGLRLDGLLATYVQEFPPLPVYQRLRQPADFLAGTTRGLPNRHLALQGLLLLPLADRNPAYGPYRELLDPAGLAHRKGYGRLFDAMHRFFAGRPTFGPDEQNLVDMLRGPAIAAPDSLYGQLEYIRYRWAAFLGPYLRRLLQALDLLREEYKEHPPGGGAAEVPEYATADSEEERYSPDLEWMPRLVLMAKSTLVWLDQLSRRYGRWIRTLDQVPDQELDTLARWGFTGLWLIGIWERSPASRRIKRLCGNPEAEPSAYSLVQYTVAGSLGGERALADLKERCLRRGIRLASDMVPNHTGLDAAWVREHPDWYIQTPEPPFPSYTFNGANLSEDPRFGIYLEDHYYDRADAAVVFKRVDFGSGEVRYIYHGNDGTHLPWNDTAQLDYLKPEVREAVLGAIIDVARRFPIVRFDAAMTLTRRHYQRLWFPEPGSGGDIPSRAERGMSRARFQRRMPREFWREVVDRVAQEAPGALLLAEAFWLMEGYFVRTLGMHRVYNSAFMNMLKAEDNRNFRSLIKNTLEFDPQILKRYVNFLNNPDEETAIAQFGSGDKYFGVCLLMATLPGLPMFGHGQVEGLREKYGMEYARAYVDEQPDQGLVERHEREIFPLLRRRWLFSEVEHFRLFDLYTQEGTVNEDVIVFSNRAGLERALVLYNNRYAEARGWIRLSAAYVVRGPDGGRELRQEHLGQALGLSAGEGLYCRFREQISGLQYLRQATALHEQGLYVELGAYRFQVFLDFREVRDTEDAPYAELCASLGGRGVGDLEQALTELVLRPVQERFRWACAVELPRGLAAGAGKPSETGAEPAAAGPERRHALDEAERRAAEFFRTARRRVHAAVDPEAQAALLRASLDRACPVGARESALLLVWLLLSGLDSPGQGTRRLAELRLDEVLLSLFQESGLTAGEAARELILLKILLSLSPFLSGGLAGLKQGLGKALLGQEARGYLLLDSGRPDPAADAQAWDTLLDRVALLARASGAEPSFVRIRTARWRRSAQEGGYRLSRLAEILSD